MSSIGQMAQTTDQEKLMVEVLKEHQENPHQGQSPIQTRIHATLHTVVEIQLRQGEPAEVETTLNRLMKEGLSRHEAMHAICSVAADEFLNVVGKTQEYDEQRYVSRLEKLSAKEWMESTPS